jgi:putative hydrolase of the HAD superfamily
LGDELTPQVRAVLFDAVGTLIYPEPPVSAAYAQAGARYGSRLTAAEVAPRFRSAFARLEAEDGQTAAHRTDEQRERRRWQNIVAEVFDDVPEQGPLFDALWRHFARPDCWRLFDDVTPVWRLLASRGLLLGVASNFDRRLHEVCREMPPLDACPHIFVSSELGSRKPGRGFFRAIERRLGLKPAELLLVGDDPDNDGQGAIAAGWRSVLIDRQGCNIGRPRNLIEALADL